MLKSLLPKEFAFFDYFEKQADVLIRINQELIKMADDFANIKEYQVKIKELEKESDVINKTCSEALHKTFITPIERTEIFRLIKRLDDVADIINVAVKRMILYNIQEVRPEVKPIAEILLKASVAIKEALTGLRNMNNHEAITAKCSEIRSLEKEADEIFREVIPLLLKEGDTINFILWKEIYERLEKAADRCKDVADVIEEIIIENA